MGGRKAGSKNYKKRVLLNVVRSIKPIGGNGWRAVAREYQKQTKELKCRNFRLVKRYFYDKICENFRDVTGKSGGLAAEAQELAVELEQLCEAAAFGARDNRRNNNPDDDDDEEEEEDEDEDDDEEDYDEADEEDSRGDYDDGPRVIAEDDEEEEDEGEYERNQRFRSSVGAPAAAANNSMRVHSSTSSNVASSRSTSSSSNAAAPASRKRSANSDVDSGKTKNSRPQHPRGGAAQAINNLATTLGQHASSSSNSNAELIQAMLTANQQNMQAMVQLSAANNMQMLQVILGTRGAANPTDTAPVYTVPIATSSVAPKPVPVVIDPTAAPAGAK